MFMNAIIAGLLYFLSFPPYDYWYLIFLALYLFYYSLLSSKKSFLSGFIFGCVAYGVILLGIQSIGLEAWIPLTFLMGLMYGVFSKLFSYLNTKSGNNFYVLLAALAQPWHSWRWHTHIEMCAEMHTSPCLSTSKPPILQGKGGGVFSYFFSL